MNHLNTEDTSDFQWRGKFSLAVLTMANPTGMGWGWGLVGVALRKPYETRGGQKSKNIVTVIDEWSPKLDKRI